MPTAFSVLLIGVPEQLRRAQDLERFIPIGMFRGVMEAANEVIRIVKSIAPSRSGAMRESFQILDSRFAGTTFMIVVGSTIPGYPYYQEYGFEWHLRGKRGYVPGKYFLTTAVEMVRPMVPEMILAHTKQAAAGAELYG
jgi:hypothetical protein